MDPFSCRYIPGLGLLYWFPWTTKACGIWGLQYGKGSISDSSSISGSLIHFTALLMNMIFLKMLYFVEKLLEGTLSMTIYLFCIWFFQSWWVDCDIKGKRVKISVSGSWFIQLMYNIPNGFCLSHFGMLWLVEMTSSEPDKCNFMAEFYSRPYFVYGFSNPDKYRLRDDLHFKTW